MTPEEHNKTLGTLHLVYGGFQALVTLMVVGLFLFMAGIVSRAPGGDPEAGLFITVLSIIVLFSLVFTIPSFVAGYGLRKRKSWAKLWGMIAGVFAGMSFPLGTALCVYSIWFLIGDGGRELYAESSARPARRENLYGAPEPAGWAAQYASREREYADAPPRQPPNWRD
jgi:hypothetical protein